MSLDKASGMPRRRHIHGTVPRPFSFSERDAARRPPAHVHDLDGFYPAPLGTAHDDGGDSGVGGYGDWDDAAPWGDHHDARA